MAENNLIDLKTGYPHLSLMPREQLQQLMIDVLQSGRGFQYAGDTQGGLHTREQIAQFLTQLYSQSVDASDLIVTTGALGSIDITCRALTLPGDVVLVESPTFYYACTIIQMSHVQIIGVPMTPNGIDLNELEAMCQRYGSRVKVVYTISAFHNPTGINTSVETRHGLIALAQKYHFTILEDATYQPLYFKTPPPPIIQSLDESEHVVTVGSVSKLLMPAIRVGWIYTSPQRINRLKHYKGDGGTSLFNSEVVAAYLESGEFDAQIEHARALYAQKHDVMVQALQRHAPDWFSWRAPHGGYFIWGELPQGKSSARLHQLATENGVDFFVGAASYADGNDDSHLRLCFAYVGESEIARGIEILSECLRKLE